MTQPPSPTHETAVNSFILRFVQEGAGSGEGETAVWHGTIRHVQSNSEIRFTQLAEALAFLGRYVSLDTNDTNFTNET